MKNKPHSVSDRKYQSQKEGNKFIQNNLFSSLFRHIKQLFRSFRLCFLCIICVCEFNFVLLSLHLMFMRKLINYTFPFVVPVRHMRLPAQIQYFISTHQLQWHTTLTQAPQTHSRLCTLSSSSHHTLHMHTFIIRSHL